MECATPKLPKEAKESAGCGNRTHTGGDPHGILRALRGSKTGRKHRVLGLFRRRDLGCRWLGLDAT